MPNRKQIFSFLKKLQANNSKEWMDENRSSYHEAKNIWLEEIENILTQLSNHDATYFMGFKPKDTISRINNNRRFNQDLPVYKSYFTFSVMDKSDMFSPIHISVGPGNSFIGCGYHNPEKDTLKKIREAIDYDGHELVKILEQEDFKNFFGELSDFGKKLKTAPKGYPKDHPHVELLRHKRFIVSRDLTEVEVIGDDFLELIEQAYVISKPFRTYLKKANSI